MAQVIKTKNTLQMEIQTVEQVDSYEEKNNLHVIELHYLNLGNNFTTEHFKNALQEHEEFQEVKDYLSSQNYLDEFKIIANGNFGKVQTLETLIDEMETYFGNL